MEIIELINEIMNTNNLTQANFAKRINAKQSQISEWLSGKCKPSYDYLKLICTEFNISGDTILGLNDEFDNKIYKNLINASRATTKKTIISADEISTNFSAKGFKFKNEEK